MSFPPKNPFPDSKFRLSIIHLVLHTPLSAFHFSTFSPPPFRSMSPFHQPEANTKFPTAFFPLSLLLTYILLLTSYFSFLIPHLSPLSSFLTSSTTYFFLPAKDFPTSTIFYKLSTTKFLLFFSTPLGAGGSSTIHFLLISAFRSNFFRG